MTTTSTSDNPNARFIEPGESLLVVIDLQEKFVPYLWRAQRVLSGTRLMLDAAHALGVPVLVTEHNPKAIGGTVPEVTRYLREDPVKDKMIFSCCGDDGIRAHLQAQPAVKNIIIAGCETHICVMQTALEAQGLGYNVHVAADAVGSRMELDWRIGLERMRAAGVVISTAEMMAYELLRRADRPEFKQMLPAFKDWVSRVGQ